MLKLLGLLALAVSASAQQLTPHLLRLSSGKSLSLALPTSFDINIAAEGFHRPRFFARSPDGRIFVTEMYDLSDNQRGAIDILTGWNPATHTFAGHTTYLAHLHNPNNVAFYTDPATHQAWLYTALTDRLLRYKYTAGDNAPTSEPEVLAHFPSYGLDYKYGGWHLTRTVAFATLHGHTRLFVAVGSSCNACREKEPERASLLVMDPDGEHYGKVAAGLRNAVDVEFIPSLDGGSLFATDMGDDHLGDTAPEDQFFELDANDHAGPIATLVNFPFSNLFQSENLSPSTRAGNETTPTPVNYGWPTCYFEGGVPHPDPLVSSPKPGDRIFPPPPSGPPPPQFDCTKVPAAYTTFKAHSSPLGLAFFDRSNEHLNNTFLVALHGAGHPRVGTGYRVVRFSPAARHPENFILGFLTTEGGKPVVHGRPCGVFQTGPDSFLLSDDLNGVIYSVHPNH